MDTCGWCRKDIAEDDERWPYGDDPAHLDCQKLVIDRYDEIHRLERQAQLAQDVPIYQLIESAHEILKVAAKLAGEDHDAYEQIEKVRESTFYATMRMRQRVTY